MSACCWRLPALLRTLSQSWRSARMALNSLRHPETGRRGARTPMRIINQVDDGYRWMARLVPGGAPKEPE